MMEVLMEAIIWPPCCAKPTGDGRGCGDPRADRARPGEAVNAKQLAVHLPSELATLVVECLALV